MVSINKVSGRSSLLHTYSGQNSRQPCFVELNCRSETLSAAYDSEIGNAVPFRVWHRRSLRWTIPALTADAANSLLESLIDLCNVVIDGYSERWDGSNTVGEYTEAAETAISEIESLCSNAGGEGDEIVSWDAADWLRGIGNADRQRAALSITAGTTDVELGAIADNLEAEAEGEGIDEINGLRRYLKSLRDGASEV